MYRVFIVDDEPLTREYLSKIIPATGDCWEICGIAGNGAEALELLEKLAADLIITDIKMPIMDGLTMAKKIFERLPQQEIVILSGHDEFYLAQQALQFGVTEYLLKPIRSDELAETLRRVAVRLEQARQQDLTMRSLRRLSEDYSKQIARSYLKAIISNSNVEIDVYHPLMYRLKVDLIEAISCVAVLRIDLDSFIQHRIPIANLSLYRYMLLQSATELIEEKKTGYVFLDDSENVVVFLTADDGQAVREKADNIYQLLSAFFCEQFGITFSMGIGSLQIEILELRTSYKAAYMHLNNWIFLGGNRIFAEQPSAADEAVFSKLQACCGQIESDLKSAELPPLYAALRNFTASFCSASFHQSMRVILFLLEHLGRIGALSTFQTQFQTTSLSQNEILSFLMRLFENASEQMTPHSEHVLIDAAAKFIHKHFAEPITLFQIADSLNVSPNYLSKLFHDGMGESYIKFITRLRMEYAAHLIETSPALKISAVAEQAGYCNLKHFSFVFKEYYGQTPRQYQSPRQIQSSPNPPLKAAPEAP